MSDESRRHSAEVCDKLRALRAGQARAAAAQEHPPKKTSEPQPTIPTLMERRALSFARHGASCYVLRWHSPIQMSDGSSRFRLPLLLLALALLVGGSKFDAVRPLEGQVVAFVVPVVAVFSGVGPFTDTLPTLRNAAFGLGAVVLLLSSLGSYGVVFNEEAAAPPIAEQLILVACLVGALLVEVAAAQRGLRVRISAWLGLAVVFALYFPGHAVVKNLFGSAFAAFLLALFVGGGAGLLLGEFAVRRTRA